MAKVKATCPVRLVEGWREGTYRFWVKVFDESEVIQVV